MQEILINEEFILPTVDVSEGSYNKTQIITINSSYPADTQIFYSTNGEFPYLKYWGSIAINKTCQLQIILKDCDKRSKVVSFNYEIIKREVQKGYSVIIGGAEHCKELHDKIIDLAGGTEKAKMVFVPTSSGEPYSSGIDRLTRFTELSGLIVDKDKVPEIDGKKDYSNVDNESNFWILPIAVKDDKATIRNPRYDYKTPLTDECLYPVLEESKWRYNAYNKQIAEKLRDGGYNIAFLSGGNQSRYIETLYYPDKTETPVLTILKELYNEKGGVVAGTSAGAAALSKTMIMGGSSYGSILKGVIVEEDELINYDESYTPHTNEFDERVWLGIGLNMLDEKIITDTHFLARGRVGRLITASLYLKKRAETSIVGIGVGEDTSVVVDKDNNCEVVGANGVLVVDTSEISIKNVVFKAGKYAINRVILHYLENGDVFRIDEKGKTHIVKISDDKQFIDNLELYKNEKIFEGDIFGKNKITNSISNLLLGRSIDSIGIELSDNLYDSYDTISSRNIVESGSTIFCIKKGANSLGYKGTRKYNWWGPKDINYPVLQEEIKKNCFSAINIYADIRPLRLFNFPDLSDGNDMPIKQEYIESGRTLDEWKDLFERRKKFKFGAVFVPLEDNSIMIRAFFFDYAYNDYSRSGFYSPPKMAGKFDDSHYKDYDIMEIEEAEEAEVYIKDILVGKTDAYGKIIIDNPVDTSKIKVVYPGRSSYEVSVVNSVLSLNDSLLKFTDTSFN